MNLSFGQSNFWRDAIRYAAKAKTDADRRNREAFVVQSMRLLTGEREPDNRESQLLERVENALKVAANLDELVRVMSRPVNEIQETEPRTIAEALREREEYTASLPALEVAR